VRGHPLSSEIAVTAHVKRRHASSFLSTSLDGPPVARPPDLAGVSIGAFRPAGALRTIRDALNVVVERARIACEPCLAAELTCRNPV
jgi:hypothetical protein